MYYTIILFIFFIIPVQNLNANDTPFVFVEPIIDRIEQDINSWNEESFAENWDSLVLRLELLNYLSKNNSRFLADKKLRLMSFSSTNLIIPNTDFRTFREFSEENPDFSSFLKDAMLDHYLTIDYSLSQNKYLNNNSSKRFNLLYRTLIKGDHELNVSEMHEALGEFNIEHTLLFYRSLGPTAGAGVLRVKDNREVAKIQKAAIQLKKKWEPVLPKLLTILATKEDSFQLSVYRLRKNNVCFQGF